MHIPALDFAAWMPCTTPATPSSSTIIDFSGYLSAIALLFVVYALSDYELRFRLAIARKDLRKETFRTAIFCGLALIVTDLWFASGWPMVPSLNNQSWWTIACTIPFLVSLARVANVAFISAPTFSSKNCERYFTALRGCIAEGDPSHLVVAARHLDKCLEVLVVSAANRTASDSSNQISNYANDTLLLLADRRFCAVVAERVPWLAARVSAIYEEKNLDVGPSAAFARNVAQELVRNESSILYSEESGYSSGWFGYVRPVTKSVFGSARTVEGCASRGLSPLAIDDVFRRPLTGIQAAAYCRAAGVFFEAYIKSIHPGHSTAVAQLMPTLEHLTINLASLDGRDDDLWKSDEYRQLLEIVRCIRKMFEIMEGVDIRPLALRPRKRTYLEDVTDELAGLIVGIIQNVAAVRSPRWTCWSVQHNAFWADLFKSHHETRISRDVGFKVRRLVYDQVLYMEKFPNFVGARLIGFFLNVGGLKRLSRKDNRSDRFTGLQNLILDWVQENYLRLVQENPRPADAMLQGSITFDPERRVLIKTFTGETRAIPNTDELPLKDH